MRREPAAGWPFPGALVLAMCLGMCLGLSWKIRALNQKVDAIAGRYAAQEQSRAVAREPAPGPRHKGSGAI